MRCIAKKSRFQGNLPCETSSFPASGIQPAFRGEKKGGKKSKLSLKSFFRRADFYLIWKAFPVTSPVLGVGWGSLLLWPRRNLLLQTANFSWVWGIKRKEVLVLLRVRSGNKRPAQAVSDTVFCSSMRGKREERGYLLAPIPFPTPHTEYLCMNAFPRATSWFNVTHF